MKLTYNDVIIEPMFSTISSREECDPTVTIAGLKLSTPIISSNMTAVTNSIVASIMREYGGVGCLPRFGTIDDNVFEFEHSPKDTIVSVGITDNEKERAKALYSAGARYMRIDVAHAATMDTFKMYQHLRQTYPDLKIFVGNFASYNGLRTFEYMCSRLFDTPSLPDAYIVGVGGGAACKTRTVAGVGYPMISAIKEIAEETNVPIIADGGINEPGDVAKALAAGAKAVMVGKLIAATEESPAPSNYEQCGEYIVPTNHKLYSGSASLESYKAQGKIANHRTPEGESFLIPVSGTLGEFMQKFKAGLQSSMSYVNARTSQEFYNNADLVQVTHAGYMEGLPENKR